MDLKKYFKIEEGRIYGLDVLRAAAIIMVILYHWPREKEQVIFRAISHFGFLGVDLFFVLSGFLITGQCFSSFQKGTFSLKTFFFKRFMRTLPNYYFCLLFFALFFFEKGSLDWRYLFFLQNIGGLYQFTHSWSLCIEEHFYLLLPFILLFLTNKNLLEKFPKFVLGLILSVITIRFISWFNFRPDLAYKINVDQGYELFFKHFFYPTYTRLDGLAVGALCAFFKYYRKDKWQNLIELPHKVYFASSFVFLLLLAACYQKTSFQNSVLGFTLIALFFGHSLIYALKEDSLIKKLKFPGLTYTSLLSYSLYLTHSYALHMAEDIINHYSLGQQAILANSIRVVIIFGIASILYWGLEKPLLLLRDKKLNPKP